MKKLLFVLAALTIACSAFSQVDDTTSIEITPEDQLEAIESDSGTEVEIGIKERFKIESNADTTKFVFRKKEIVFIDSDSEDKAYIVDRNTGTKKMLYTEEELSDVIMEIEELEMAQEDKERLIEAIEEEMEDIEEEMEDLEEEMDELSEELDDEFDDMDSDWSDFGKKHKNRKNKFDGHWAAFEVGINGLMTSDYSTDYEPDWLNLNSTKSWNYNLNFAQTSVKLIGPYVGLVTGLGLEFNNYTFDGSNNITKVDGVVVPDSTFADRSMKKNKFSTIYFNVPLLMEFHFNRKQDLYVQAGVIGGLKIANAAKIVYYDNGKKKKHKEKGDDLNLRALRYGLVAKIGYEDISVFARYYLTSLFEEKDDPELYPFSVGLAFNF